MAKRGGTNHLKRMSAQKSLPIRNKKEHTWIINPTPGPHAKRAAIPLTVLLRDVLGIAKSANEIKKMVSTRKISVDGTARADPSFPVGFMDIVSFADKNYRIGVDSKARLVPIELPASESGRKIMKVVGKNSVPGGKFMIRLHNGRVMGADNNIRVGDSVIVSVPAWKLEKVLKLDKGARCLIREGKHAGLVAKLDSIIERKEGRDFEAKLSGDHGEFITVAKYLFVVDDSYKGAF